MVKPPEAFDLGKPANLPVGDRKSADMQAIDLLLPANPRMAPLLTSLHTSISAQGPPTMTIYEHATTAESLTYKRFRSPAAIHEQSWLEIDPLAQG